MSIWYTKLSPDQLNAYSKDTMSENLEIVFTEIGDNYLKATMPINNKTVQPMRLLHGGASVVLAETMGSVASWIIQDPETINGAVGIEINASHMKSAREGSHVTGIVSPLRIGKKTHVWEIKIYNQAEELCCISRLTTMILPKRPE